MKHKLPTPAVLPTFTCLRCGHIWNPRVALPARCARCLSLMWATPRPAKLGAGRKPMRQNSGWTRTPETQVEVDVIDPLTVEVSVTK